MVQVHFNLAAGSTRSIEVASGESVMQAALNGSVKGIIGDCGGSLACATCHVHVVSEWLDRLEPPSPQERQLIEMAIDPDETSRLSCQIKLTDALDGLTVRVPERQF
jgi:2Fe-2S ferredoxin